MHLTKNFLAKLSKKKMGKTDTESLVLQEESSVLTGVPVMDPDQCKPE